MTKYKVIAFGNASPSDNSTYEVGEIDTNEFPNLSDIEIVQIKMMRGELPWAAYTLVEVKE